jgi:hypothetical protein
LAGMFGHRLRRRYSASSLSAAATTRGWVNIA